MSEYFRKFGHDIEMAERRQKRKRREIQRPKKFSVCSWLFLVYL